MSLWIAANKVTWCDEFKVTNYDARNSSAILWKVICGETQFWKWIGGGHWWGTTRSASCWISKVNKWSHCRQDFYLESNAERSHKEVEILRAEWNCDVSVWISSRNVSETPSWWGERWSWARLVALELALNSREKRAESKILTKQPTSKYDGITYLASNLWKVLKLLLKVGVVSCCCGARAIDVLRYCCGSWEVWKRRRGQLGFKQNRGN